VQSTSTWTKQVSPGTGNGGDVEGTPVGTGLGGVDGDGEGGVDGEGDGGVDGEGEGGLDGAGEGGLDGEVDGSGVRGVGSEEADVGTPDGDADGTGDGGGVSIGFSRFKESVSSQMLPSSPTDITEVSAVKVAPEQQSTI
jgi:hypothetical protein